MNGPPALAPSPSYIGLLDTLLFVVGMTPACMNNKSGTSAGILAGATKSSEAASARVPAKPALCAFSKVLL